MDDDSLRSIAASAQRAVVDPAGWESALAGLCAATGASGAALFSLAPSADGALLVRATAATQPSLDDYAAHWLGRDAWIEAAARRRHFETAGQVETGRSALPLGELRRTAFHADFLRRHDIEELVSLKVCDAGDADAPPTHLSLYRPAGAPLFDAAEARVLRALWPSVQAAVRGWYLLARGRAAGSLAAQALEALPGPVWVLHDDAVVAHANGAACAVMRRSAQEGGWLRTAGPRLAAVGEVDAAALKAALCAAGRGEPRFVTVMLPPAESDPHGLPRCAFLHVSPLAASPPLAAAWPAAVALLVLRLPREAADRDRWLQRLRRAYGLTTAECRVLERLAAGLAPRDIAEELAVSCATVRTHLRALHAKTGCRRQAELVRLAAMA